MLFFILGNPRSGTTMFRLMLNAHSKITVPPESGFALWFAKKYRNIGEFNEDIYSQFVTDLLTAKKFETWELNYNEIFNLINQEKPRTYAEMIELVYQSYALKQSKHPLIFGDKNNYYINHIDELIDVFPSTKLVFIIRDGRDVAASYKKINEGTIKSSYKPVLPVSMTKMAEEWVINANSLLKYMRGNTPAIFVRYEDLLDKPEEIITKVFSFLGLEYESNVLNFYKHNDEPKDFLQWKSKTTSEIDSNNKEKYKTQLTLEEIAEYNNVAADMLKAFDYPV